MGWRRLGTGEIDTEIDWRSGDKIVRFVVDGQSRRWRCGHCRYHRTLHDVVPGPSVTVDSLMYALAAPPVPALGTRIRLVEPAGIVHKALSAGPGRGGRSCSPYIIEPGGSEPPRVVTAIMIIKGKRGTVSRIRLGTVTAGIRAHTAATPAHRPPVRVRACVKVPHPT